MSAFTPQNTSINGWNYTLITTNATTVVKTGGGVFGGIFATAAGSAWTVNAYDNTAASGNQLVVPAFTVVAGQQPSTAAPSLPVTFNNGLTIVTAGSTPGTLYVLWQ